MPIKIVGLTIYPVKGLRGIELGAARLTPLGLAHDRRWMIVMPNGRMVTQRQIPALATIATRLEENKLWLESNSDAICIDILKEPSARREVTVWRDSFSAALEDDAVGDWLTRTLGSNVPLRLVRMPKSVKRPQSNPQQLGADTSAAFADAAPLLITNCASLNRLNRQLEQRGFAAVPMNRFRSNIVIEGLDAFAEYQSALLTERVSGAKLQLRYPSERCIVTTIDQQLGNKDPQGEPFATLRAMNSAPGKIGAYFGQNASVREPGDQPLRIHQILDLEPLD